MSEDSPQTTNQNDPIWVEKNEPRDVLYRLKRGLAGYVSYLAACEMNEAFSEYILYEPILRILTARGFKVECEYPVDLNDNQNQAGDKKRIDFSATSLVKPALKFAIEVKWAKKKSLDVKNDYIKLQWFKRNVANSRSFLCVFGRKTFIENPQLQYPESHKEAEDDFSPKGEIRIADLGKTKYGCRIYELKHKENKNAPKGK